MIRFWLFTLLLVLGGCMSPSSKTVLIDYSVDAALIGERDKVLAQPDVDPLTEFIARYQGKIQANQIVDQVIAERDARCAQVFELYAKRVKEATTFARLKKNYHFSCPKMVDEFIGKWQKQSVKKLVGPEQLHSPLEQCRASFVKGQFSIVQKLCAGLAVKENNEARYYLAESYHATRKYEQAYYWAEKAALDGNKQAQFLLGKMYGAGQGVPIDTVKSLDWKEKSARQNHIDAQIDVARQYFLGTGVEKNYQMAKFWYTGAAKKGNTLAQFQLGELYHEGLLGAPDPEQALYWYNQAAIKGSRQATFALGTLYSNESYAIYDPSKAYLWFKLASINGYNLTQNQLKIIRTKLSKEQQDQVDRLVDSVSKTQVTGSGTL